MHSQLTPFRICRNAIIGLGISLLLMILYLILPWYSYRYFHTNETMNIAQVANANKQIMFPMICSIISWVFILGAVLLMLFLSKKKLAMYFSKLLGLLGAFIFLALFIIALVRLWSVPYEFENLAYQQLKGGYLIYLLYTFFSGVLSCYILGIHEK